MPASRNPSLVCVVDGDAVARDGVFQMLDAAGFTVRTYWSAKHFLSDHIPENGCLIADVCLPGLGGPELLETLSGRGIDVPVIFTAGHADLALAVRVMKAGAADFLLKPFDAEKIVASVEDALKAGWKARQRAAQTRLARDTLALLTPRERHVLEQLLKGHSNKVAAHALGISMRTVEFHRAHIMEKLGARSMPDLLRVALTAEQAEDRPALRAMEGPAAPRRRATAKH